MMYIDKNKINISNTRWIQKATELLDAMNQSVSKEGINEIIDKNHRYWKMFKQQLKNISYNKCWYSETRNPYSHYHVDHFRPKKKVVEIDESEIDGYWWLAFDYNNFRLSGSVGNTKKSNYFAVKYNKVIKQGPLDDEGYYLLDPCCKEDTILLNFSQDGRAIESAPENEENWHFERAKYTIEKLDLNYPDLVEARLQKWQDVTILIKKVNKLNIEYNEQTTATKLAEFNSAKNEIRKLLAPCSELTSTVRSCLRSSGQNWAYRILEENIDDNYCN